MTSTENSLLFWSSHVELRGTNLINSPSSMSGGSFPSQSPALIQVHAQEAHGDPTSPSIWHACVPHVQLIDIITTFQVSFHLHAKGKITVFEPGRIQCSGNGILHFLVGPAMHAGNPGQLDRRPDPDP